jgi:predicted ester cyclase
MSKAQPVSIGPVDPVDPLGTLMRRYYALFNERRFDDAEQFVHPQAVFTYPMAREHLIGRAGYRDLTRRWLEAFPDARIVITSVTTAPGGTVVAEWVGEGSHRGVLDLSGMPSIPATGVRAELPMRETVRIADGLIVSSRMEFDPAELCRRLGLDPALLR